MEKSYKYNLYLKYNLQKYLHALQSQIHSKQKCLTDIYFEFIHSYLNYANIAWASTNHTKVKTKYTTNV